jgi:Fe-S-cluster containining protein
MSATESSNFIAAGDFDLWLKQMCASLHGAAAGTDVPCGDCVGCCISSYPVPIRPSDGLDAVVPDEHIVQVSASSRIMVPRDDGTCPMLQNKRCSIYARRPETCRDYDCRIFAAAGIEAGGAERTLVNERVRAWRFVYATPQSRLTHEAIKAAARFIRNHTDAFTGRPPTAPTGIAVLAVKSFTVFLDAAVTSRSAEQIATAIVAASREFDSYRLLSTS